MPVVHFSSPASNSRGPHIYMTYEGVKFEASKLWYGMKITVIVYKERKGLANVNFCFCGEISHFFFWRSQNESAHVHTITNPNMTFD